ncbi:serine/threonine-protein phosphatase 4 regulatory subunit 2-like isoform X2 [Mus caroli]|uniref:Serine/threonine-protein phosphatase 4 regulatory subunit 2-like isoform X2 n=1 Tax=Mus caroli TaxID=10089 RepID=A0A6P5PS59_MUSCR|nr:serine/threonine-protein phosphatase 4 regulatory subunit 2-like isoform X2 [Mus caroli]
MSVEIRQATPSWSLSWYIQKYVSWILRIRKERTEVGELSGSRPRAVDQALDRYLDSSEMGNLNCCCRGCCIPDEDVPQRKRHFVYGTRTRLWPPSRVESTDPNDDSNRVIMEVVPCVSSEEQEEEKEEEKEEEEESVGKVESLDKENGWIVQRQWDWSSDEEDCEGHSISVTALVHAEACWSDTPEEEEEEDKAEAAISSQDDASKEGEPVATKTAEAAAL